MNIFAIEGNVNTGEIDWIQSGKSQTIYHPGENKQTKNVKITFQSALDKLLELRFASGGSGFQLGT